MAKLSNLIEDFLIEMIEEENGTLEIQRSSIAEKFNCAPSQINYVLTTRFTPYKGYYVESRRGGGGYLRIVQVEFQNESSAYEIFINEIKETITKDKADKLIEELLRLEYISKREADIIRVSLSDRALSSSGENKNEIRASILKNILLVIFK